MAEWTVNDPSGREIIVTAPDGATQEQVIRYAQEQSHRLFAAPQEEEKEEDSWAYTTIGAPVIRGWNQLETTEAVMGNLMGWRSDEEAAELIAEHQRDIAATPMSESTLQGLQAIQEVRPGDWWGVVEELVANPAAIVDVTISSLVSSIPGLVGFVGGLFGGGAVGTALGGPGLGTAIGATAGASTGAGTGSLAVEYSQAFVDAMNQEGTDTQNGEQVLAFLNDPQKMEVAREFALNRGIPIAAFDALTAGIAGKLFGPTAKMVAGRTAFERASEAGRTAADTARRAALESGVASAEQVQKQASRAALRATGKQLPLRAKVAGAGVELLSQATGGGSGEAAAQIVTEGHVGSPGEVGLEAFAELLPGTIEATIASRRPRVAPAPRDPTDIPAEPAPLTREAYDAPIGADLDPVAFVQQQAQQFAQDTPVSMTGGVPSTSTEDYNVVPFKGTDDAGVEFSGWRVETKAGIPITPVIDNEARAEGAREAFVGELKASFAIQEQEELNMRADEALGPLRADENPDLFQAAKQANADTVLPFNDLSPAHQKKINSWRANNKDEAPRLAAGMVAVEEMSLAGLRDKTIDSYLAGATQLTPKAASVQGIKQLTAARNIRHDDQAFQDFVRRVAGGRSEKNSWQRKDKHGEYVMGPAQLGALKERLEELGATLPGEERQSIPVPKRKPFTAPQYNAVVSSARRQGERDTVWKVEKVSTGKTVPNGSRFFSEQRAQAFRNNMKDSKGTRITPYKIKAGPLREGEIQKSDVTEVLGGGVENTDAILDAAVERGDLIKVRDQQRWRVADYAIREAQPMMPGLKKRLAARLRGAGISSNKIALELVEKLEDGDKGDYVNRVMRLALNKVPENATPEQATAILGETLDHEIIHALVELGVLTKADMALLGRFVTRAKVPTTDMTYLEQAHRQYSEHRDYQKKNDKGDTVIDEDAIVEEAAAEAFRDFAAGRLNVVGKPRTLFRRIIDFFRGVSSLSPADAMYFTARFTPIVEGRVAQRGVPQTRVTTGQRDSDMPEEARPRRRAIDPTELDGQQPDGSHPYRISGRTPQFKGAPIDSATADERGFDNPVTQDLPVNTEAVFKGKARGKGRDDPAVRAARLFRRLVPGTYMGFRTKSRNPEKVIREVQDHMVDNLLWLYMQLSPEARDRAKLWYAGGRELVSNLAQQYDVPDRVIAAVIASLSPQKDWYMNVSLAERVLDIHTGFTRGNKKGFVPDNAMRKKAIELFPKLNKKRLIEIMSRPYEDHQNSRDKAIWVRVYDEVNNPQAYRKITPEGKWFGEAEGSVGWGSTTEIAKAIRALEDQSKEGIHRTLGSKHKIRNFYNNLLAPNSTAGDITVDTHAVGAAFVLPVSGNSSEVNHNFGTSSLKAKQPKGWVATTYDGSVGAAGTYGIIADAYREAAQKVGILPREMQSITWEAVRLLFPATWKNNKLNLNKVRNVWKEFEQGKIGTKEEARDRILEIADGIKNPDWFNTRDQRDDGGQSSSYDGELAQLRLRNWRQARESATGTGRADRGAGGRGPRHSLAEAQPRRRAIDERVRSGPRSMTEREKKSLQRSFGRFRNVTDRDFVPLKIYNGGVTPVFVEGKRYPVVLLSGHNEWAESLGKYAGWGQKHAAQHLDDIVENTNYNSVDSFVSGILNMYNANRINKTLKEAGFEVFETDNYTDNILGKKLVMRWWYDKWATPGTLVMQPINLAAIFPGNPAFHNKSFASLVTAYALPVVKGKYNVRPTQIISPAVSLTAKRVANGADANRPILTLPKQEKRKHSLNNPEGLDASDRALRAEVMGSTSKERKTLGDYVLGMFRYTDHFSRPSRWRWNFVDRWEGVRATEVALRKKFPDIYANIYADSSAAAMMAMLDRSAGLMQQFLTAGPVMYSRGMFHAINERIVEAAPPELRMVLRQELSDLKVRAGYAPEDEVKGLMQIFTPLYDLRKSGAFDAWELYAAARRAERLLVEGREFLMTNEMIEQGLAIADKPQYQDADGNSVIKQVYDDYQKLNNALILMMEDANLISKEAGQMWRDNSDYLPFYRELFVDDTRGGGLNGQVVYDLPATEQDEVLKASSESSAAGANNNLLQNMYNVPAPRELKGGRTTFFIMVNGIRDVKVFDKKTGPVILERIDQLKRINPEGTRIEVKASTQRIQDPLENILRNANAAITASMRNVGMLRAIRDLGRLNMATRMKPGSEKKDGVSWSQIGVRVNGETVWFETSDRLLLNSMQATGDLQIPGMSIMSTPANVLRELVTKTPDFMLANMLRDTVSAWATSGANVWPLIGTTVGFGEALGGGGKAALLRSSGVFGGYDFKNDPKDAKRALQKYMRSGVAGAGSSKDYLTKGWIPSIKSPLAPAMKLWQFADDVTVATDMGTRIAVYNAVLRETGNEAQAAYEALEVINFSRKGRSAGMRFVTAMVPFLNARIQGLDVLWRGSPASADGVSSFKTAERKRRFIWRMATLVALSAAYTLAHSEDPEEDPHYANATDEKKDMYFILKPEWLGLDPKTVWVPRIPIAFEVGLLTKTLPERLIRLMNGTDDFKAFREAMYRGVVGTLNMNPIPQFMKPLFEASINLKTYDMSSIVPYYSEANAPEQARAGVGETARELAKVTGISAEKIEHILMAYTGTLGRYALQGVDSISRSIAGYPDAPAMNPTEYPFFQRFLQSDLGGGDLQSFYALREALTTITNSIADDEANMNFESADRRRRENWPLVSRKARINYLDGRIADLRRQETRIRADRILGSEEKRKYIRQIKRMKSEVLTGIRDLSTEINRELRK